MPAPNNIIEINTTEMGILSVDAREILAVRANKHGKAIVAMKTRPNKTYDCNETYAAVLAKWKAAQGI